MDSSTVHCNSAFSEDSVHKSPVNQYWINLLDCIPSGKLHTFGVKLPQWGGSNTRHGSQRSWCLAVALGNLQPSLRRYAKPNSPWNVLPTSCKAQNTPHTNTYTKAYRLVVSTPHCRVWQRGPHHPPVSDGWNAPERTCSAAGRRD